MGFDTTAPIPDFTGASFADGTVTLAGTSEPGSTVWIYERENRVGTAIAAADGTWLVVGAADANASHTYGAVAWDQAGNQGSSSYGPTAPA